MEPTMDEARRAGEQKPDLRPCPFCGHVPARNIAQDSELVMLVCPPGSDCDQSGLCTGYLQVNEVQALAAWNRRATPAVSSGQVIAATMAVNSAVHRIREGTLTATAQTPDLPEVQSLVEGIEWYTSRRKAVPLQYAERACNQLRRLHAAFGAASPTTAQAVAQAEQGIQAEDT